MNTEQTKPAHSGENLEWLNEQKLLELIAHDINNFAHAAISYIDLAADPKISQETRERFLGNAKDIVQRTALFTPALRLLVEAQGADPRAAGVEPFSTAFEGARARVAERRPGVTPEIVRTGDAWEQKVAGGPYLRAAIATLIDNAIRFARPGHGPKMHVDVVREAGGHLQVTFRDEGRGFSAGQDSYAAKRFSQPGRVSGAGLGLAMCRIVVQRLGGSIQLANASPPPGAVVVVRLPEAQ